MINFIAGLVVGGGVVYLFLLSRKQNPTQEGLSEQELEKQKNIAKLREFIAGSNSKITNDQVEKLLKVSNSTAERYLDDLEKEGLLKQVGKTGVKTYYEKI